MPETPGASDALPVHPITGLRAVGFTSRGPVWPIAGAEDGSNSSGGDGGDGQGGDSGGAAGQPATAPSNPPGDGSQGGSGEHSGSQPEAQSVDQLPEWAQKVIRDTRKEAGDHRTAANQAESKHQAVLDGIAKALGVNTDGGQAPDADKLTADLQASQDTARQRAVELAVYRSAAKQGGDPDALLDSRTFADAVSGLDPDADGFTNQVAEAIKKAVTDNPKLAASQAPAASGAQFTGGSGEGSKQPKSLSDAVAARYR